MAKQCRYAKTARFTAPPGYTFCYCTSPGKPSKGTLGGVEKNGNPIMGYTDGTGWWPRCIDGKSWKGVTPSKCVYYR